MDKRTRNHAERNGAIGAAESTDRGRSELLEGTSAKLRSERAPGDRLGTGKPRAQAERRESCSHVQRLCGQAYGVRRRGRGVLVTPLERSYTSSPELEQLELWRAGGEPLCADASLTHAAMIYDVNSMLFRSFVGTGGGAGGK